MRKLPGKKTRYNGSAASKQRGVVVPIVVIGLLALLAVAGLALDGSHALGNKTRMQNAVDAAALAAAKVLDDTRGDTVLATAAANSLFAINASSAGNHEMNDAHGAGDISVEVQYSLTLNPSFVPGSFVPGSIPTNNEWWVRVIATGFDTQTTLSKVLGIDEISTPATAVAGPSGPLGAGEGAWVCDIAPIAVCEDAVPGENDEDVLRVLKPDPGVHDEIGPGNYKMLRMYNKDGTLCNGGDCLRENLAGSSDICIEVGEHPPPVETEPGEASGPVSHGFNTRFERYGSNLTAPPYYPDKYIDEQGEKDHKGRTVDGDFELKSCAPRNDPTTNYIFLTDDSKKYCDEFPDDYDPETGPLPGKYADDLVETADQVNYNYCNYSGGEDCMPGNGPDPGTTPGSVHGTDGVAGRRLLRFPVVKCDGMANGQSSLDVLGVACFFMLQSLEGSQSNGAGQIFGQYIGTCPANGDSGSAPGGGTTGPLLYKIQLYKNPDSTDS